MSSNTSSDFKTVAALGRLLTLGMLYDARKDKLVPGYTLWDTAAMQKTTTESPNRGSRFQVTASDTIESRLLLLDIEPSLKASFFAGLIEVGGSAQYLNDQKISKNQSRVTCHYHATTHFKQLLITNLGPLDSHQMETIKMGLATHVVTGIQYGANAFFVFDSEKMEESKIQEIKDSMEALIKKIPAFNVGGKVEINLTDEEKGLTNKFSCKFYGDFESNPTTFEEAVRTYVDLPKLIGPNGENAAPLKVWLLPLNKLDSKAAELSDISVGLMRKIGDTLQDAQHVTMKKLDSKVVELISDISVDLMKKIEDTLKDAQQVTMRCNDSLADQVAKSFPEIGEALSRFQTLCNYYTALLRQVVAKELPAIREGTQDESFLLKVFQDREQSPFSHDKLSKWLDYKEREITVIHSCVDMMKGTHARVVQNRSDLDREILSLGVSDALCFVFTSLETSKPVLDEMSKYLDFPLLAKAPEELWCFSNAAIASMGLKARAFSDIAKALKSSGSVKFLVTASPNDKYEGASIYHYKEGALVTEDFSKPKVLPVKKITEKSYFMKCKRFLDHWTRWLQEYTLRFDALRFGALLCCFCLIIYSLSTLFVW